VKTFLVKAFAVLLEEDGFRDSLYGHLDFDSEGPGRVSIFLGRVRTIASMEIEASDSD